MKQHYFSFLGCLILLTFCSACDTSRKSQADLIVHNALIYTVDSTFNQFEALAVKDGKFIALGSSKEILEKYDAPEVVDAQERALYPGFNDAHCHFYNYGRFLQAADLVGTQSYEEILQKLQAYQQANPDKKWIIGRGWDQNDWETKEYPTKAPLDSLFPDTPVFLSRIDGHAALVNQAALDLAQVPVDAIVEGGKIERQDGEITGVLVDNAIGLVSQKIPPFTKAENEKALLDAQEKCFAVGLTSLTDAGLDKEMIELIDQLQKEGKLKMRIYAMISNTQANRDHYLKAGPYQTDFLHVRSFKLYADGALGSRGACLLEPYADSPDEIGFLRASPEELEGWIAEIGKKGFQVNTHCIGDSANRFILNTYAKYLKGPNDRRWRIEHAQIVHPQDVGTFSVYNIIPSVQPTHATSDMYWADERLGPERVKTAYAFQDLWRQNLLIPFGSDFPVEDINPLYGLHAAVVRRDAEGMPKEGFQRENALGRQVSLKAMTIWAAYAAFEEKLKGSIAVGKMADFVILKEDIMKIDLEKLRDVQVWRTYLDGQMVYNSENKETTS